MKTFVLFFITYLLIISNFNLTAQVTISGSLSDHQNNPIPNALIEIINPTDSNNIFSGYSNINGQFSISAVLVSAKLSLIGPIESTNTLTNYPNPFNPSTIIHYNLERASMIKIIIYDILGRKVKSLYNGQVKEGPGEIIWGGTNDNGHHVSAGIYFCRMETDDITKVHKMIFLDGGKSAVTANNSSRSFNNKKVTKTESTASFFHLRITHTQYADYIKDSLFVIKDTSLKITLNRIYNFTVNESGGIIGIDGFSLTIPPGAFSSQEEITVNESYDSNPFGKYGTSSLYIIRGMPDLLSSVKVIIKSNQINHNQSIAVGNETYFPILSQSAIIYNYFEGEDSSDYIYGIIDIIKNGEIVNLNKTNTTESSKEIYICAVNDLGVEELMSKVILNSPSGYFNLVNSEIINAINTFNNLNFYGLDNFFYLTKVIVSPTLNNNNLITAYPVFIQDLYYHNSEDQITKFADQLVVGVEEKRINSPTLSSDVYSSLFSAIQGKQSVIYTISSKDINNYKNLWLHNAINCWAGSKSGIYPHARYFLNTSAPLNSEGLAPDINDITWNLEYGYGLSSLIKYFENNDTNECKFIIDTYNYIRNNNPEHHISGLINAVNISVNEWYPDYIDKYLTKQIFDFDLTEILRQNISEWNINTENDTIHEFLNPHDVSFFDLSSKFYRINCNHSNISNDKKLLFTHFSSDVDITSRKLMVYELAENELIKKSIGNGSYILLNNIKPLFDQNKSIYCVITNSKYSEPAFDGENGILLKAEVVDNPWWKQVCKLSWYFMVNVHEEYKDGSHDPDDMTYGVGTTGSTEYGTFTVENNVYSGEWNYNQPWYEDLNIAGFMEIEYDELNNSIKNFYCTETRTLKTKGEPCVWYNYIRGVNIPNIQDNEDNFNIAIIYETSGTEAHLNVTDFGYSYEDSLITVDLTSDPIMSVDNEISIFFQN